MEFLAPQFSITLPSTAGIGDTRIFIGQPVDPLLYAAYKNPPGPGDTLIGNIIFYNGNFSPPDSVFYYIGYFSGGGLAIGEMFTTPIELIFLFGVELSMTDVHYDPGYNKTTEVWHNLSYQNGWANFGGAFVTGQYRRIASPPSSVQIVGVLATGTKAVGTIIANLPDNSGTGGINYRPLSIIRVPVTASATTAGASSPSFDINPNGNITVSGTLPAGAGDCEINCIIPLDA